MFLSREVRDLGVAFQDPPGCQASSRGEAKNSAVLPSRDADLLEPPSGLSGVKPPLHFGDGALQRHQHENRFTQLSTREKYSGYVYLPMV